MENTTAPLSPFCDGHATPGSETPLLACPISITTENFCVYARQPKYDTTKLTKQIDRTRVPPLSPLPAAAAAVPSSSLL